ncbi:DUF2924 domain-containing protein [Gymnodinialimonas ulvae]|uniref:DUF2924 domain-containing protein n=1 Tax=Gymnodinialimonas ulvae TaxID=3126504 RepID=UPI0030A94F83
MRLTDLETAERSALIEAWGRVFATPVPKGLSKSLMRRFLATELQTKASGGLSASVKRALAQPPDQRAPVAHNALQPGGRLLREWNGITHVVDVTGDGFLWQGQSYRSLSAIARHITGAHWSGPRFFGLTRTKR